MYSRYTEFRFDAADRAAVHDFWATIALPSAAAQPGWRAAYILESEEEAGVLRTFTLWERAADFERYQASEEHTKLGQGIKASGLRISARDGLSVPFHATAGGPVLRVTRARIEPDKRDDAAEYWRTTGGPMMRRATGCLKADAYWSDGGTGFELVAEWAGLDDAERFLSGPDHQAFGAAMERFGSVVHDRIVGERIG